MATSASKSPCQGTPTKSPQHQAQGSSFEPLDKSASNTLKRNPKMGLTKADLLTILSDLEGELQARDIVIATLKSEKVKQLLQGARYRRGGANDALSALQRDNYAATASRVDEAQIRALADHQMASLENLVLQQRRAHLRMARILKETEERHRKVVQELEEEKRKHEHDTAQGDDITYGLEKERTRLKQELEMERQAIKKLEKELKKAVDTLEEERNRQKQIVLLLLAERKQMITKYIEERKRSEDLAQILSEEKGHVDSMAEGLEEESKKSLQMEAELEKQLAQFDTERQQLRGCLMKEERRCKDLETEGEKLRAEVDALKKQLAEAHQVAMFQAGTSISPPRMVVPRPAAVTSAPPQPPAKPTIIPPQASPRPGQPQGAAPLNLTKVGPWGQMGSPRPDSPPPHGTAPSMVSSVAKVVQPTATVSSVPVSGPTTGIARSVSPGQGLRIVYSSATTPDSRSLVTGRDVTAWSGQGPAPPGQISGETGCAQVLEKSVARITPTAERSQPQVVQMSPRVSLSASPGTKVFTTSQGGKVTYHVTANAPSSSSPASASPSGTTPQLPLTGPAAVTAPQQNAPQPPKKPIPVGRGVPPPIPPNKPVVPPKKEAVPRTVVQTVMPAVVQAPGRPEVTVDRGQPVSFEVNPQKLAQGFKFGITISKDKIHITNPQVSQSTLPSSPASLPAPDASHQPMRRDHQNSVNKKSW